MSSLDGSQMASLPPPTQQQQQQQEPAMACPLSGCSQWSTMTGAGAGGELNVVFDNLSLVDGKTRLLGGVSGVLRSGELTAVVSCCGSRANYHFMAAVAGQADASGTIMANGTPVTSPKYLQSCAFIDEDLTNREDLSVKQNILYSAEMRVADRATNREKVTEILALLELEPVAKRKLKHCSVFLRRRVSLAKELMLSPKFLYVDGILEGLAAHEAKRIIHMCRQLSRDKEMVVALTLTQPRWAFLELFESTLLFESDRLAFAGQTRDVLSVGGDPSQIPESIINSIYRTASSPDSSLHYSLLAHPTVQRTTTEVSTLLQRTAEGEISLSLPPLKQHPYSFVKLFYLLKYSVLAIHNSWALYAGYTMAPLIVAVLIAAIYKSQSGQAGMQNRIGIVFFLISGTFLHNMLFVDQHKKAYQSYQRHRSQRYFGPATYLSFVVLTSFFVRFLSCALFTVVVYGLANVESVWDITSLRDLVAIVALSSFTSHLLVWLVCCLVPTARIAHFILFAIYAFNTILAGIILNMNTLPKPFQILSFGSLIRLGYESAVVTQFEGQSFGCTTGGGATAVPVPAARMADTVSPSRLAHLRQFLFQAEEESLSVADSTIGSRHHHDGTTSPTGGMQQTVPCYTGPEYMSFLGFSAERRWKNLEVMAIIASIAIVLSYLAMAIRRSVR